MKIAIFGDSFGDDKINWEKKDQWLDVGPSWVDYLKQHHDLTNYSLGGSCLYYSKKKFDSVPLDYYDKVIFIVTESVRRYQLIEGDTNEENKNWNYENSLSRKNVFLQHKHYLETIHNFFVYMHNESDEHFHQLMIEDIKRKRNDVLMINYNDMLKIANFETDYWFSKGDDWGKFCDARKCHMSEENNLIFGRLIKDSLEKNIELKIDLDQFVLPSKNFEYYFRLP